jgi:hypothetical protein
VANVALLPTTKCCNRCKQYLPFNLFSKNSANKDRLSSHCKECDQKYQESKRRKSPEKQLEYGRQYQQKRRTNFDFRLKSLVTASKQRAIQKGLEHNITVEDIKEIYPKDGCCPVFGFKLEFGSAGFRDCSPSIDRIDPSKGYVKENIQILSWRANRLKVDATIEELEMLLSYLKQGE